MRLIYKYSTKILFYLILILFFSCSSTVVLDSDKIIIESATYQTKTIQNEKGFLINVSFSKFTNSSVFIDRIIFKKRSYFVSETLEKINFKLEKYLAVESDVFNQSLFKIEDQDDGIYYKINDKIYFQKINFK